MSCEERESGSYELPAGEFARFKREIKAQWDQSIEQLFQKTTLAQAAYPKAQTNNWGEDPIEEAFSEDYEFIQASQLFLSMPRHNLGCFSSESSRSGHGRPLYL